MLLDQIREAGIIGAGGAGFPTHAKLNTKAEYLLMNAAECEPLLRVDQQIMVRYADTIIEGFAAAGRHLEAKEARIGIKEKHGEVIEVLKQRIQALGEQDFVKISPMRDVYPAGDEQVLVYELTGRTVPESGIPIEVGCVVVNSETALNIGKAMHGEAVTETYITLAGDIPHRVTFAVPVGMPMIDVLKCSGIDDFSDYAVIDGGPMMGGIIGNINKAITKKHKGFVILKKDHPLIQKKMVGLDLDRSRRINRAACEQCRMCTDLCPRFLIGHNMQPHKMMSATTYQFSDDSVRQIAFLCCQCGLCSLFSCPANLYPKEANLLLKSEMMNEKKRYQRTKEDFQAHPMRSYRLVPSKRLIARLQLSDYDQAAPLVDVDFNPERVKIMMVQHIGAAAVPTVSVGDRVSVGQKVGDIPEGALGATVHASISGIVEDVQADAVTIRRD